jgi:death on curing protein
VEYRLPVYETILRLHDLALEIGGGLPGILNKDRILAAIDRPQTYMDYDEECDIHLVCAILMHGLATGHGFTEGNKRTALLTVLLTYVSNGRRLSYSQIMKSEYRDLVLWVVQEKPSVKEIAPKLRAITDKYSPSTLNVLTERLRQLLSENDRAA